MNSASFDGTNSGTQVGTNQGVINILPGQDRGETPQQRTDHEVLRSLAFPQMLDRRDNIEPCHTNTCEWILELEKYKSWRSLSCGLLWIKGKPGAGKSTLMAFLHNKLKTLQDGSQDIRLDFFFTARGAELQRTPLGMFKSLLNQIFECDTTVRSQVRKTYERRCRQFGLGELKWEWPRLVLEELLTGAILESANRQPVTVFVDALDEAGAESAQQIATYFHRLIDRAATKKAAVQICISCRHYPIMGNAQAIEISVEDHNLKDISRYIRDTLAETEVEKDGISPKSREAMIEQLIQQANGVFQWAHLMMPLVKRRMLEGESFDDIRCWLREIPAGLEDVYTYILNDVIEERNRGESFLLFAWICLAERPLNVTEMRYALAANDIATTIAPQRTLEKISNFVESNERMKRRIKALSGGLTELVVTRHYGETVQVIHQSVNDFVRAKGLLLLHQYVAGSKSSKKILLQCQAIVYRSCMAYLATADLPQEILDDRKNSRQILARDFPFLGYATTFLFVHAEKAAGSRADAVQNELHMLQQVLGRWVQCYQALNFDDLARPANGTTLLHIAAAFNLVDILESVLSYGEDVTKEDENRTTAFHLAARWGHIPAGKILLEKGANQEARCRDGLTPLVEAAKGGNMAFIEWLLHKGPNLESTGRLTGTALQVAALKGYQDVVRMLIAAGAKVNAQGGKYSSALQAAALSGSAEIVGMLLNAQADVNAQGGHYGNALQAAAYCGHIDIVAMLLNTQADVNAHGGIFGIALQAAAFGEQSGGIFEIVEMILETQADVNAQGGAFGNVLQAATLRCSFKGFPWMVQTVLNVKAGMNLHGVRFSDPLEAITFRRSPKGLSRIVQMLLNAQADVNARGGIFGNALQAAAFTGSTEVLEMLLNTQANVNAQGGHYGNALQAAAYCGHIDIVAMLLNTQADVNAQGGLFGNALQAAAYMGSAKTVEMLLNAQANVNAQGGHYGNALQAATYGGSTKIVKMLLDSQADVNAQGGHFGNALQAAAYRGSIEGLLMLLDAQADVNAPGGAYGSPLLAATHMNELRVVQILLTAGADVLLADELGQTPLHIASTKDRCHILHESPLLSSAANKRDKLLRTPLHLAIYLGHTKFASMLLKSGANPSLPDGHGRNIMDWASGNQSLMNEIRKNYPHISLTPVETQIVSVRQSVFRISDTLLRSRLQSPWALLRQLGRYLLFVNELENARYLFQLHLSQVKTDFDFRSLITCQFCEKCDNAIFRSHFVCKICAYADLCSSCVQVHSHHTLLHPDQRHETFEVPEVSEDEFKLTGLSSEFFRSFLRNLVRDFPAPNTDDMEMESSHDSTPHPPLKRTRLV